jgi:hypothetical protein
MNAPASLPQTDDHAAWAQAALRRQVERLDELAELGLAMARAIEAERSEGAVTAFSRMAKAVRLTGLVQSRLIKDIEQVISNERLFQAPARERARAIAAVEDKARNDPARDHKRRVEKIVDRVAQAETDDEDRLDRLADETIDRLDDEDLYGDVLTKPVGELVALICRDLGLDPDWNRLAEEAWAKEEIENAPAGSPFTYLPHAAAGGGPIAEERVVEGAGHFHPPPDQLFGRAHASG